MTATSATTVLHRPLWVSAVTSFVPHHRRVHAERWASMLPIGLILLVQAALMLRQDNAAFQDEGLYINAGHDYLSHFAGGPVPAPYGTYLSGVPAFYPVIAAALDQVGGLLLVRLFSAACVLATTWLIFRTGTHLWGRRCGLVAAALFAINGSVLFVGVLATYDALCLVLIAAATYLAVTRTSRRTAVLCGLLLFTATLAKYTGIVFVPMVAGLAVVTHRQWRAGLVRAAMITVLPVVLAAVSVATWAHSLLPGIEFTTSSRHALTYMDYGSLMKVVARDCLLLLVVAIAGLIGLLRTSRRSAALGLLLVAAAVVLPAGQIRIHEFTSLDKHIAYGSVFLALLAGRAVATVSLRNAKIFVALGLVWVTLLEGLWRSDIFFHGWPDESQIVAVLDEHAVPGTYVAFEADSFAYYLRDNEAVRWQTAYALFNQGTAAVVDEVHSGRIAGWVFRTGAFGLNSSYAVTQAAMLRALASDPQYRLVAHRKAQRYSPGYWFVYEKVRP